MSELLTAEHRKLLKQFIEYKERNNEKLDEADRFVKWSKEVELSAAMKTPVMEAEHAIDDCTAMSLYDCLIPKLREQRRFRFSKDDPFSIADFKAQVTVR